MSASAPFNAVKRVNAGGMHLRGLLRLGARQPHPTLSVNGKSIAETTRPGLPHDIRRFLLPRFIVEHTAYGYSPCSVDADELSSAQDR